MNKSCVENLKKLLITQKKPKSKIPVFFMLLVWYGLAFKDTHILIFKHTLLH